MNYVKDSYRVATSPAAKKTYLNAVLFFAASLVLLCIAALIYPIFYYNYVPKKVISIPIHLQYNSGLNPYGVASLSKSLMLEQAYDVSIELTVPRSPTNLDRGNFMVALFALKSQPENPAFSFSSAAALADDIYEHIRTPGNVVFMARRPSLIPYSDPLVAAASRVLFLFYHILYPAAAEKTTLVVPMGELVEFRDVLPLSLLVDVQAGQTLQVYEASVTLVARLSGIRWAMYNHRVLSFVVCTTIFWISEMLSMGLAWLFLSSWLSGRNTTHPGTRKEVLAGDAWMTPSLPARGVGGMRLTAGFANGPGDSEDDEADPEVKQEDDEDDEDGDDDNEGAEIKEETIKQEAISLMDLPQDADDEEDGDDGGRRGSGAGTSFSHGQEGGSLRRRSSRGGGGS
ncbi:hypothetical protein AAE478_008038 [Parahypoxylon ruwenzoriense]